MIGMIVATHGSMSDGILDAANLIIGTTENIEPLSLYQGDDVQALNGKYLDAIKAVDQGEGLIVFTDLASASPYNQAVLAVNSLTAEQKEKTYVIAGVNLPMVIEAINQRMIGTPVKEAVNAVINQGQQSLVVWTAADTENDDEDEDDF